MAPWASKGFKLLAVFQLAIATSPPTPAQLPKDVMVHLTYVKGASVKISRFLRSSNVEVKV